MKEKNKFMKKFSFSCELGKDPNNKLFDKIFEENFMNNNYRKVKSIDQPNFKINQKAEDIKQNNENNDVYIFTYEYLIKNGLLLELNTNFFELNVYRFKKILEDTINKVNSNIENFDKISSDYGFELIQNLSILYVKIKDLNSFYLSEQLYGEAKSVSQIDLNNIIEKSVSKASRNTSDIVGQYYEESVLLYFLIHSNINSENILPRLLFYMNFIIFYYKNKKINMEFIPFNQLSENKYEGYNEMDFSFYTKEEIRLPMLSFGYQIFCNTLIYNYKEDEPVNNNTNDQIIFPEKTLTFFELKNNIKRTDDKKSINLPEFISYIQTFIGKLPIYIELYKSKQFINNNCKNIKFVFFYDHQKVKFEDSVMAKNMIKKEIDKKFNDIDININIQIIFGSKQIQSINYYELFLENRKTKNELNNTKDELNNTKNELNNTKNELNKTNAVLQETIEKVKSLEKELKNLNQYLPKESKIDVIKENVKPKGEKGDTIDIDEEKAEIKDDIGNLKKQFTGIKLKIFEEAITLPEWKSFIYKADNYVEIINNLSERLVNAKYEENMKKEQISKKANQLIKKIIKQ